MFDLAATAVAVLSVDGLVRHPGQHARPFRQEPQCQAHHPACSLTGGPAQAFDSMEFRVGMLATDGRDWFRIASIIDDAEFVGWSQWQRM